jgi:hypothetical protein
MANQIVQANELEILPKAKQAENHFNFYFFLPNRRLLC